MHLNRDQSGFTLVELMIVVSIGGLIVALAIPRYQKFVAKARQTEAKVILSDIFSAEKMAAQSISSNGGMINSLYGPVPYTLCIKRLGVTITSATRYYAAGFGTSGNLYTFGQWPSEHPCVTGALHAYDAFGNEVFPGTYAESETFIGQTAKVNADFNLIQFRNQGAFGGSDLAASPYVAPIPLSSYSVTTAGDGTPGFFRATAQGNVSNENVDDIWTIDQDKNLINAKTGL